jgi:hypothetical protein
VLESLGKNSRIGKEYFFLKYQSPNTEPDLGGMSSLSFFSSFLSTFYLSLISFLQHKIALSVLSKGWSLFLDL